MRVMDSDGESYLSLMDQIVSIPERNMFMENVVAVFHVSCFLELANDCSSAVGYFAVVEADGHETVF